ncbi:hypothetical protein G4G28_22480 [Massilia sp. Dwa41.01b]|uniref:hypothetical protein n=1 Tax=unclassified Massilia TaxID=2609279 RepID=UPI00160267BE|nr:MULTISPECIES: hypothetical protein [unclassified Massilia]QNA90576.1 hypothetical protein G4G28_22480 [Massilia sp. Dwa41.01b]QNA97807.1 hypothetical protein G4G31_01555 [Massilia sp. Se16.2.3]
MNARTLVGSLFIGAALVVALFDYRLFGLPWYWGSLLLGLAGYVLIRAGRTRNHAGSPGELMEDLIDIGSDLGDLDFDGD